MAENKDWTGNKASIWKTLGASNHTDKERQQHDFYASHPSAIDRLLKKERLPHNIWECACVDSETEVLTRSGWVRISDYTGGEIVICDKDTNARFETPLSYIQTKTTAMYHFKNIFLDLNLSQGHRVLYINNHNVPKVRVIEDIEKRHQESKFGFKGAIPTTIVYDGELKLDEHQLRLAIAIQADGSHRDNGLYKVSLKKERKISRMRYLLEKCNIEYKEGKYGEYTEFRFKSPYGCKLFPHEWYQLCKENKQQIIDEVFKWDGSIQKNANGSVSYTYFTCEKKNADFIQFCLFSSGYQSNISADIREGKKTCYRVSMIHQKKAWLFNKNGKKDIIKQEGLFDVYCFKVRTGFFLCRRNGKVFVTGNCGESHLAKRLKEFGHEVVSTDLVDRGYGDGGKDFLMEQEFPFSEDCCILTNPPFKASLEFIEHALRIAPSDDTPIFMLLKTTALEGKSRHERLYRKGALQSVYQFTERLLCAKNGDFDGMMRGGGSAVAYGFFEFKRKKCDAPRIYWI